MTEDYLIALTKLYFFILNSAPFMTLPLNGSNNFKHAQAIKK
jgi:hypothetical protein